MTDPLEQGEFDEETELVDMLQELSQKMEELESRELPDFSGKFAELQQAHKNELAQERASHAKEIKDIRDEIARILHES